MASKRNWLIRWGSVGLLFGIPFVYLDAWFVALLGVVLLLRSIDRSSSGRSAALGAWFAFTVKYLFALGWFWTTYPIDWLAVEVGNIQIALIMFCWVTCAIALGIGGIVFVLGYRSLKRLLQEHTMLLWASTAVLWVVSELLAAYSFSIVSIGPGGAITPAFSFGYSGYLLAQHEMLLQFARVAGVYGLGFLFMCIGCLLYDLDARSGTQKRRIALYACSLLFVAIGHVPFVSFPDAIDDTISIAIIDTRFPVADLRSEAGRQRANEELYEATAAALRFDVGYIILPEDSRLFDQSLPVSTNKSIYQSRLGETSAIVLDTGRFEQNGEKPVLQAFVYDGTDDSVERVQKRYLVPQGEFLSSLSNLMLTLVGFGDTVEQVGKAISFRVGPYTDQSELDPETPAILFCFESVDPLGVRKVLSERPNAPFIAHPISHAWFHEPTALWRQLDTMLRVQALWNNAHIVSAGGHVSGKAYAPNGGVLSPQVVAEGQYWSVKVLEVPRI